MADHICWTDDTTCEDCGMDKESTMNTSVKLRQVEFHQVDAWRATIAQPGENTIVRYYPFSGGEWIDLAHQTIGTCDFRATSDRRKAWRRIRSLYTEVQG